MPAFVHLAPEKWAGRIRRNGIRRSPGPIRGVFAMPASRNYFVSHQWLRELKRGGQRTIVAIDFRIDGNEEVYVGRFGKMPELVTASEAVRRIREADDPLGWEVRIPRRILPREIRRVRRVRQVVGWRYWPEAKSVRPCPCRGCQQGEIKGRRIRYRADPQRKRP